MKAFLGASAFEISLLFQVVVCFIELYPLKWKTSYGLLQAGWNTVLQYPLPPHTHHGSHCTAFLRTTKTAATFIIPVHMLGDHGLIPVTLMLSRKMTSIYKKKSSAIYQRKTNPFGFSNILRMSRKQKLFLRIKQLDHICSIPIPQRAFFYKPEPLKAVPALQAPVMYTY